MDKIKHYKFQCGIEASQEELTLARRFKMLEIIESINVDLKETDLAKMKGIINLTLEPVLTGKLLDVILTTKEQPADWSLLKVSELDEVMEDFFVLNPQASKLLMISNIESAITNLTSKSSNGGQRQQEKASDSTQQ